MAVKKSRATAPQKPRAAAPAAAPAPFGDHAFSNNLSYRLSILGFLLGKATAQAYRVENLTTHQFKVMSVICNFAPIPASEVMRWVTLDKSAISRAVRKLHVQGLIERKLSSSDARVSQIMPTRKGRDMYKRMSARIAAVHGQLLASVPERKVKAMFDAFSDIEGQLRTRYGGPEER